VSETNRVAVYHNNHDVRIEERPRPVTGPGELLLRIEASGICGSDVMEWYRVRNAPRVLGHEVAGEVVEAGLGVVGFERGDRVVATHHVPCGTCLYCHTDRPSVCETLRRTHFDPGGFAEYVRLPPINVQRGTFKLLEHLSFEEGTFVEPLACAVRSQRLARVMPGMTVAVFGSGVSGILQIQLARTNGAHHVIATDVSPWRLEMAQRFGADIVIPATEDVPARVREANRGRPADVVIVCTGAMSAIDQAFKSIDWGGTIMLFAPADPGATYPLPLEEMWSRGINVMHSYAGPPHDMHVALHLLADHKIDVASMVTHRLPLERTAEGFRMMAEGGDWLKIIVEPQP